MPASHVAAGDTRTRHKPKETRAANHGLATEGNRFLCFQWWQQASGVTPAAGASLEAALSRRTCIAAGASGKEQAKSADWSQAARLPHAGKKVFSAAGQEPSHMHTPPLMLDPTR